MCGRGVGSGYFLLLSCASSMSSERLRPSRRSAGPGWPPTREGDPDGRRSGGGGQGAQRRWGGRSWTTVRRRGPGSAATLGRALVDDGQAAGARERSDAGEGARGRRSGGGGQKAQRRGGGRSWTTV